MYLLAQLCMICLISSVVRAARDFELDYSPSRADDELMQDLYKRLASIDLQDVKRDGTEDAAETDETSYESFGHPQDVILLPSNYKISDDDYDNNRYKSGLNNLIDNSYHAQKQSRDMEEEEESAAGDDDKIRGVIRDPELTEHSSIFGILHLKDHDREHSKPTPPPSMVAENVKSLKSDDTLPFYCHPPNPCPKGFTSKDGCQEFIEDTAEYQKEWIRQMQRKGLCSCDEEHMFDCTEGADDGEKEFAGSKEELEKVFDKLIKEKQENPFTHGGRKRTSLVAKKSPRFKRNASQNEMEEEMMKMSKKSSKNPYLEGDRLPTVAKKGQQSIY